jgi:hypothetical protein
VLQHHSNRPLLDLGRIGLRRLPGFHGSILSGVGASGKRGAVQKKSCNHLLNAAGQGFPNENNLRRTRP